MTDVTGDGQVVLLVSHADDDHLEPVRDELARLGAPYRVLDTADLPQRAGLTMSVRRGAATASLQLPDGPLDLTTVGAVWWRRPQGFALPDQLVSDQYGFTYNELHEAVNGLWSSLEVRWVNPPWRNEWAIYKGRQLALAAELGLAVPATCITSDPQHALAFVGDLAPGRVVYKAFSATESHWRETRLVGPEELAGIDAVRVAPVIFQEYVEDSVDLRVTIVGDELFPAAIHKRPGTYEVDVRMDLGGARFEPVELPDATTKGLLAMMERLGLRYGAVDLKQRPDGSIVFLEVNPAGQWRWVEERTGQPITNAVVRLLVGAS